MYTFPLLILILTALAVTVSKNGVGSFVTLGILGAAIYSIPALINLQASLGAIDSRVTYVPVAPDVKFLVLLSWTGLLVGLGISIFLFPQIAFAGPNRLEDQSMKSIALACAIMAWAGVIYFMISEWSIFFFLKERMDQDAGAFATLWRWTGVLGLVSALLARNRRLLYTNAAIMILIFLRGDRTLVAIATAAMIVAASYRDAKWWRRLSLPQIVGVTFAAAVVFLGKTVYLNLKSGLTGQGWDVTRGLSYKQQLISQFEPLATFNHIEFVMRTGVKIPFAEFVSSILGNILLVPSAFGVSTNVYNATVTAAMSSRLGYGIAGNYLAHGYVVGGTAGAVLFYLMLPLLLRLCDGQFRSKSGTVKVVWCGVGAVVAFYIHRNGLDNLFSFIRQLFIVSVITAALAAALRQVRVGQPPGWVMQDRSGARMGRGEQFVLKPVGRQPRPPSSPPQTRPPAR
jgi:hypothetical protein